MNDLTVARGGTAADVAVRLRHDHVMAGLRCLAGDRKADDPGPHYQNLHGSNVRDLEGVAVRDPAIRDDLRIDIIPTD